MAPDGNDAPQNPGKAHAELRRRLEQARMEQGLSKSQLVGRTAAKGHGLSRTTISEAFNSDSKVPTRETVYALAKAMGVDPAPLVLLRDVVFSAGSADPVDSAAAGRGGPSEEGEGGAGTANTIDGDVDADFVAQARDIGDLTVHIHPPRSGLEGAGDAGIDGTVGPPGRPIGECDPYDLEVHPAIVPSSDPGETGALPRREQARLPGYVRRAHDDELDEVVAEAVGGRSRMAMLVGGSSTGKTRACWEAVQSLADKGWRLWHPVDPTHAEAALAEIDRIAPYTVVWLNEAQHYLGVHSGVGERVAAALHTLLTDFERAPVLVLGTLWPEYADTFTERAFRGWMPVVSRCDEVNL